MSVICTSRIRKKEEVLMVVAIFFLLLLALPVVSAQEEVPPTLTAIRSINPDNVIPGSTFKVNLTLKVEGRNVTNLTLDEGIPHDWTVTHVDNAEAMFYASELKWIWLVVNAEESKTVSYDITVPSGTAEGSYPISGEISASNVTPTSIGGELAVAVTTPPPKIPPWVAIVGAFIIFLTFGGILFLGWYDDHKLIKGEMRRAIAGTFVVGFTILVILCLTYDLYRSEVILAYTELVGIVIGFYFGTRTAAEKRAEAAVKISIEHVRFPDPKKIAITIRNGGDSEIKVDKIYINEGAFETDIKIDPQKSKEIEQVYEWKSETEYKIKIATTTGLTAEITKKTPEAES